MHNAMCVCAILYVPSTSTSFGDYNKSKKYTLKMFFVCTKSFRFFMRQQMRRPTSSYYASSSAGPLSSSVTILFHLTNNETQWNVGRVAIRVPCCFRVNPSNLYFFFRSPQKQNKNDEKPSQIFAKSVRLVCVFCFDFSATCFNGNINRFAVVAFTQKHTIAHTLWHCVTNVLDMKTKK